MKGVVFSKDRAMQLDATLRSLILHCKDLNDSAISIIYKTTTPLHDQQYKELIRIYSNINFVKQQNFRADVLNLLYSEQPLLIKCLLRINSQLMRWIPYFVLRVLFKQLFYNSKQNVLFLVDDNLFVRDFSLSTCQETLQDNPRILAFSLRLGQNTTFNYPFNRSQLVPVAFSAYPHDGKIVFDWTTADGDFGYPLEVSSSVYRANDLFPLLLQMSFRQPNQLEEKFSNRSHFFRTVQPLLACFPVSVTFCNPINKVQTVANNRAGTHIAYTSDQLAKLFDDGYRINIGEYNAFIPNACHQEVQLEFEKRI